MINVEPFISVIIPAYNEEKRIARCLQSLQDQTYPSDKFEIIVVDNGSSDKTEEIAQSFGAKVLRYEEMHVIGAVRQYGVSYARAQILAFVDSDSVAAPDWLASIDEAMKDEKVVSVCGVGLPIENTVYLRSIFEIYNQFLRVYQLLGGVLPWGFNIAVRKDAFEKIGGFNKVLKTGEDWDLGIRLQQKFGRKKVIYSQKLKVYTSTRKQVSPLLLGPYLWGGLINYINIVILHHAKATEPKEIR